MTNPYIYAIRSMRDAMTKDYKGKKPDSWTWDDIEAYVGGALSFFMPVDDVLWVLRAEDKCDRTHNYHSMPHKGCILR